MVTLIAAITSDRAAIGRGGEMLFHLPADLRRFRRLTTGHAVVMGRKTFESLPKGALPERRNIVVTRNSEWSAPGAETASTLEHALEAAGEDGREVYVIGGGEIYAATLDKAQRLELTIIEAPTPADADTFFPEIDAGDWEITELSEPMTDERTGVKFRFVTFGRSAKNN